MKIICITGLDGSGKSTQVKLLAKKLPNSTIVSVWDLISKPEFTKWSIYKTPPNVENYVMNLSPTSRSLFIFHSFNEAYERAINSNFDYLIFDSYWYKYWAIEQAMESPASLGLFLEAQYKTPDITFYLDLPNISLKERKPTISHYESGSKNKIDYENFLKIQKNAKIIIESYLPKKSVLINADLSIIDIENIIFEQIIQKFSLK